MEMIHRTETELIPPAKPGDAGSRVVMERRSPDQRQRGREQPAPQSREEAEADAEAQPVGTTVYDPEGHVEAHEAPTPHRIDFTA